MISFNFLIADDHPLYREAILGVLSIGYPNAPTVECESIEQVEAYLAGGLLPDLLLLDLNMPGVQGLDGLERIRNQWPFVPVAVISAEDNRHTVMNAMALGAVGFIPKSLSRSAMAHAISTILSGDMFIPQEVLRFTHPDLNPIQSTFSKEALLTLTAKQLKVLQQLSTGASNKQIADHLHLSESTVKTHVSEVLKRLGVQNRVQAANMANSVDFSRYFNT